MSYHETDVEGFKITDEQRAALEALEERIDEANHAAYHAQECAETCTGERCGPMSASVVGALAWALNHGYLRIPEVYTADGKRPPGGRFQVEAPDGTRWYRLNDRAQVLQLHGPGVFRNVDFLFKRYPYVTEVLTRY